MDNNLISKSVIAAGAALAVLGIVLFIVLWVSLGNMAQFPRLLLSLCVPPAIMALVLGGYILLVRPGGESSESGSPPEQD